jgi:RNA polymerase sigma factor (sigma-70 family)
MITPPPLSDDIAWRKIIVAEAIKSFTPEQILAVYDARPISCNMFCLEHVLKYLIGCITRRLHQRFGRSDKSSFIDQCKRDALSDLLTALVDEKHPRFIALRVHFQKTINFAMLDAIRAARKIHQRFPKLTEPNEEEDQTFVEPLPEGGLNANEAELIRQIDIAESMRRLATAYLANKHLKTVFELTHEKRTQKHIATQIGISERQVRRLQKKIIEILAEPDME